MNYKDKSKEELIKEITELQTTYHQLESKYTENSFQIERNQSIQEFQSGIADALVTSPNLIHFLHIVREELSKIMDTNNFFVAFYNEETGMLRADLDLDTMDNISEWSAENSLTGYLLKLNKSKLLTKSEILELIKNKKASMQGTLPECWLGVPLYNDKKVMGAIVVQSYDNPDEYNLEHESILRLIANQLSVFILHKENENKLKESEKSFRGLFHTIGDSIYVMNYDSQFIDINTGALNMYGYSRDELLGQTAEFLSAPGMNDMSEVNNRIELTKKGEPQFFEFWGLKKDGTIFPKSVRMYNGTYFGRDVIISLSTDNTETLKATHEIKKNEELLRNIIENSTNVFYSHDTNHVVNYFSPQIKHVLGYEVEEAFIKWTELASDHPVNEIGFAKTIKAIETGVTQDPYELELIHKSGDKVWIEVREVPVVENGKTVSIVGSLNDITERKKAEEKLKRLNNNLFSQNYKYEALNQELSESIDRIQLINEELVRAKEKAEESDQLKSAFLANMSHEIRTPMNGILGFTELLKDPKLSSEENTKFISIIEKSGTRLLNIINDLIDLSKIESRQMDIIKSEVNINELIEYIYNFFKPEITKKGLALSYNESLNSEKVFLNTDREKIYAILINLVKNAIKYSDEGFINFGYHKKNDFFEFFVEDSGIGIDKSRHQAIFERFIQADISDPRALQGAGLGLTITKAYVELLGGKISVESELGGGSKFLFTIPITN